MRARTLAPLIVLLAACQAGTDELSGRRLDASSSDTGGPDLGFPDSGVECVRAADCTESNLPPCESIPACKCGCYSVCSSGRCTGFCDDSPECRPQPDAGVREDAGDPSPACTSAAECPMGQSPRVCPQGAPSCAFEACVDDCNGPRTCSLENDCVSCTTPATPLPTVGCPACFMLPIGEGFIEESTCELGIDPNTAIQFTSQPDCSWIVDFGGTGASAGRLVSLDDGGFVAYLAMFSSPCLVSQAPTGALRTVWSCAGCNFTLFHR